MYVCVRVCVSVAGLRMEMFGRRKRTWRVAGLLGNESLEPPSKIALQNLNTRAGRSAGI